MSTIEPQPASAKLPADRWPSVAGQRERPTLSHVTSAQVYELFRDPPAAYSTAPFWVWNDNLSVADVRPAMQTFAAQGIRQLIIHPRPGLMVPYLGEIWFALWREAVAVADELDMLLWIYDENSYPSGFAGGLVPRSMPAARGLGLEAVVTDTLPTWQEDTVGVFALRDDEAPEDVSAAVQIGTVASAGRYILIRQCLAPQQPWYAGAWYVDLLQEGVTSRFLDTTLTPYERELAEGFGHRIRGVFMDEPHISPAEKLPWTPHLPPLFQQRWGYDLMAHLPALFEPVGDYRRVRHNYYQLLLELFIERWAKPYYEHCNARGLELTGHYWEHDWPLLRRVPDSMAMYAWQHRPGIDMLLNQFTPHVSGQVGNLRAVLELSSVANQLGRERTLCEAYGASGYELRLADMKRIGDWLYALGVNTLNQHAAFQSLRGARKRDHPPTFSSQQPWWESYHHCADYFARLSVALSAGRQRNRILVLEPTTTAWMYNDGELPGGTLSELADDFHDLLVMLAREQVEFDIGCEHIIATHGRIDACTFRIGRCAYDVVVLPPRMENIGEATMRLLQAFLQQGGTVISCTTVLARVDGQESACVAELWRHAHWHQVPAGNIGDVLRDYQPAALRIERDVGCSDLLFHQRRQLADGQILFLANSSTTETASGRIVARAARVEIWNAETGAIADYPCVQHEGDCQLQFTLPPTGSLLLRFADGDTHVRPAHPEPVAVDVPPAGDVSATRIDLNVCLLDYVDLDVGGRTYASEPLLRAAQRVFEAHGLSMNPWDRAVQAGDELIARRFASSSGFAATYRFDISTQLPEELYAIVERADLYAVTCNGQRVEVDPGSHWRDASFLKFDIRPVVRVGSNELRIEARPFTMLHELEAAYLLGDFSVDPTPCGFVLTPPRSLQLGPWCQQGLPFYATGVRYVQHFDVAKPDGQYAVTLPAWDGAVARVTVNEAYAGSIWHGAGRCDVTDWLRSGRNRIEVTVVGTLRNTLGPHHGSPPNGIAHPGSWDVAPPDGPPAGATYDVLPYGLWEPFHLLHMQDDQCETIDDNAK